MSLTPKRKIEECFKMLAKADAIMELDIQELLSASDNLSTVGNIISSLNTISTLTQFRATLEHQYANFRFVEDEPNATSER